MELDNAILPNLPLHVEKELEGEGAEGSPVPGWQHQPSLAVPASPGGKAQGLTGEASVIKGKSVFFQNPDYNSGRLGGSSAWKLK